MSTPCLELVIYKIKDAEKARAARRAAQELVKTYDGFLSWTAYDACEEAGLVADAVLWRDIDCAKRAGDRVMKHPVFAGLMAEVDGMVSMAQYQADRTVTSDAVAA
ncbi:hypothetical protein E1180_00405 [Roseibium denhamense]|uniref:Antibiotic biosynthesis monooxygenase n=1 Tax=Roseibium denhamense TaxID=76305 RepID=A0ABY1NSE5_9HYPH|nr:hypothetical protein [Roseibium denhamense]MTI03981.1 hypothetical protein [Roseibium denhamense]SMP17010.1 hypothetical protein SAMN06265374_1768 [Roseibium denhamense]